MPKKSDTGKLIKRPDSKVWQYYFRYKGKTYRGSTGEIDRVKAQEKLYRIQHEATKSSNIRNAGNISVLEFRDLYLSYVKVELRRETLKSYRSAIGNLVAFLGLKYPYIKLLKEITPEVIDAFKLFKSEDSSLANVHNNIKVFKTMFRWATEGHSPPLLAENPIEKYKNYSKKKIREGQKVIVILTLDDLGKFVEYTKKHYPKLYPLYLTYMYTGAREKELFALTWDDVDFDNKLIKIRYKKDFIPKTDERTLPLHHKLVEILKAIPRTSKHVFTDTSNKPFMYPDSTRAKGYYESHKPYRCLGMIMKAIGKPEFTRLHWLRHSYATIIAKEKGIKFAQDVLGHKDIKVTERYIHFDREYLQENLNKIEALDRIFR